MRDVSCTQFCRGKVAGPFEDRFVPPGMPAEKGQVLTLPQIKLALFKSGLLGRRSAREGLSSKGFGRLSETPVLTLAIDDKKPAPARKAERTSRRGGEPANSRKFSPGGRGDAASPSETGPASCLPRHKAINGTMTASRSAVPQSCSPAEEPIDVGFREISTGQESLTFQHRAAHSSGRTQLALPPVESSRSSEIGFGAISRRCFLPPPKPRDGFGPEGPIKRGEQEPVKPLVLRATSFITKPARHPPPPPLTIEEAIAALASAEPGAASAFSEPIAPERKHAIGEGRSGPAPLGSCGASQAPRPPVSRRGEARQRERRPAHQPPVCVPEGSEVPFPWVEAFAYVLCLIGDLATKPVETPPSPSRLRAVRAEVRSR